MDKLVITDEAVVLNGARLNCVTAIDIHIEPDETTVRMELSADVNLSEVAKIECRQGAELTDGEDN